MAVANFKLLVQPSGAARPLPLEGVNVLQKGWTVTYIPSDPGPREDKSKAQVTLLVLPDSSDELLILDRKPATSRQHWEIPQDAATVALAYGPSGFDDDKVRGLVTKDRELITQLANYSERTAQAETLMEAFSNPSTRADKESVEAALLGFAKAGAGPARLDRNATLDQQTMTLMRALNPALSTYDPLAPEPRVRWQQSAGLAAAVAGLFFGNSVAMAATGATMFLNLRSVAFPKTEFRSALRRDSGMCAKKESEARTRIAYLWARRLPSAPVPVLELPGAVHLPAGLPARIALARGGAGLSQVQRWKLVDEQGRSHPVDGIVRSGVLEVPALPEPGTYTLFGEWDWQDIRASQPVTIHEVRDLSSVRLAPESADALIGGRGKLRLRLAGVDLQFVTKIEMESEGDALADKVTGRYIPATGPAKSLEVEIDTNALRPGAYRFRLTQVNGVAHSFPVDVHPEPPVLRGLPVQVHHGPGKQTVRLQGERLEQLEKLEFDGGTIALENSSAAVTVRETTRPDTRWDLKAYYKGRNLPVVFAGAMLVLPPPVRVVSMQRAPAPEGGVALAEDEFDATHPVSFSMELSRPLAQAPSQVQCGSVEKAQPITPERWFVTVRPAADAAPGCVLKMQLERSGEAVALGRLVRVPQIEKFTLTATPAGENRYWGELAGTELQWVERVGWEGQEGVPVSQLPAPAGSGQTLRVVMPWPSPAPHAPLFIWLRGEKQGRATTVRY